MRKLILAAAVSGILTGCSGLPQFKEDVRVGLPEQSLAETLVDVRQNPLTDEQILDAGLPKVDSFKDIKVFNGQYVNRDPVPYEAPRRHATTSLSLNDVEVGDALRDLSRDMRLSVAFAGGADPRKTVSVDILDQEPMDALRMVAEAAGYAVIYEKDAERVVVSPVATYIFRLPSDLFDGEGAKYSASNGSSADASSEGGMNASSQASFSVGGSVETESRETYLEALRTLLPEESKVSANWVTGLVTVTADAQGLSRVQRFIEETIKQAMTKVELEVAVAQAEIKRGVQYGVDWGRVLSKASKTVQVGLNTAGSVTDAAFSAMSTSASVDSVIKALSTQAKVSIMTKPRVMASNNRGSVIFSGQQRPYVGSMSSSDPVTGESGDASVEYALDGVSLGIVPNVLDDKNMNLKILPLLSTLGDLVKFDTGSGTLSAYEQYTRQLYLDVPLQNGQTIILGGISTESKSIDSRGVPGLSDIPILRDLMNGIDSKARKEELLILVNARIIPAPKYQPLVASTL